jgi:hypothetical protein
MRITTTTALAALTLTAAGLLAACDAHQSAVSDEAAGYCQQLKAQKAYFLSFAGSDPDVSKLDEAFRRMHALAAAAPPKVAEDWGTIDDAVVAIEDGMKDAGLSFDDLAAMQDGDVPPDVDLDKLTELGTRFEALSAGEFDAAADRIASHAQDTCGFELPIT